jgi:hypothetical protein
VELQPRSSAKSTFLMIGFADITEAMTAMQQAIDSGRAGGEQSDESMDVAEI